MRIVLSWLRELCPTDLGAEELAEVLTRQGVKVEAVLRPWEGLDGVVVARVLEVGDHPNSDTLCLARVSFGSGERELVVGVRNMAPGDLVPLAGPGATLPGLDQPIGSRRIRGVVSEGMLCSPRELGISADHGGILILPPGSAVGAAVKETFGLDDAVLDIEVWSNRPDLLSVVGVAREASTATGVPVRMPDRSIPEAGDIADARATVEVLDQIRCPRYLARVITGVAVGPSPIEVQARLTASGMRPLSNVVDATNYAMLELGQPMHPFDLALLAGRGIVVRRAAEGERLVTLDDVERTLIAEDLLIADREKGVGIAGVMGSATAEVSEGTTEILLESAHFERRGILHTARRLGLQTEASTRFGRGADPEMVEPAAARAARLMARWAGGVVLAGTIDVGTGPQPRTVSIRPSRASLLLGYPVEAEDVQRVFERLGMRAERRDGRFDVEIPSHRWDLDIEADLIEEVARVNGYERVPETLPPIRQPGGLPRSWAIRAGVQQALARSGMREAVNVSFASAGDLDLMGVQSAEVVRVANPLATDDAYLRPSLIPGLVAAARHNLDRGAAGAALFEVGHVFRLNPDGDGLDEWEGAAGVFAGAAGEGLMEEAREFDFFDAKGALQAAAEALAGGARWEIRPHRPEGGPYHPARAAALWIAEAMAGVVGELHPRTIGALDLPARTSAFEVRLQAGVEAGERTVDYREVSRFPPVRRDLAFVVDEDVPSGAVEASIRRSGGDLVDGVVLFDLFIGDPVPEGRKSLAFSLALRAPDRTLTDQEAEGAVRAIVEHLRGEFRAELRS